MFAILVPATLAPLIITLYWAERKAKRIGLVEQALRRSSTYIPETATPDVPLAIRLLKTVDQLDLPGLILLGTSVALILLPLTLSQTTKGGWHNGAYQSMRS